MSLPGKAFPVGRVLIAALVVPVFPLLAITVVGELGPTPGQSLADRLLAPLTAPLLSWPGYVVFFLAGVPTIYLLYRWNHFGFALFAAFGALYTSLAVCFIVHPYPFSWSLYFETLRGTLPLFAGLGALAGILTRLVVFGRRRFPAGRGLPTP